MPHEVTCDCCRHVLRVPDSLEEPSFTCPRCLATIRNPGYGRGSSQRPETPLRRIVRTRQVDREVQRDVRTTSVGLILLAVIGGMGIAFYLFASMSIAAEGGGVAPILTIGLLVAFIALVTTGIMYWRTRENPAARGVGRVILGTLAISGGLFLLMIVLGFAAIVFFLVACFTGALR